MERPTIAGKANRNTAGQIRQENLWQDLNKALRLFAGQLHHAQDEKAVAGLLCQAVHDAMGWQQATVFLLDQKTGTWDSVVQVGHEPERLEQRMAVLPAPPGDAPWQREEFRVSHSYYVPDVSAVSGLPQRESIAPGAEQSQALLIVFLEAGQDILGLLSLANRDDGQPPARQQIEQLEILALQAAIAIESVRLSRSKQMWADFVSNVSHELRTPLTNIKLYQRYLREGRRPELRDQLFDILEAETGRLEQIIERLLDRLRLEQWHRF